MRERYNMDICARQFTVIGAAQYRNQYGIIDDFRDRPRNMNSICLVKSGAGRFVRDGKERTARPGDIVFTPVGTKYFVEWTGRPNSTHMSLHFSFPPMGNPYKHSYSQQIVRSTPGLEADIAFIIANFASEPSSLRVLSRYYAMVDTLFGMLVPDSLPETLPEIQKARQFIDENCCRKLTIDEIAAQCGLSRSYFHHQFKVATGITPIEYKNRAAIAIAERILSENRGITIEEVSAMTGFESAAYFRRVFRKLTCKTPTGYKKTCHGEEPVARY